MAVSDLHIPTIGLPILLQEKMWTDPGNFDPAFWKYEGAQAKIVVYYPRNEVKSCENSPLPNRK